MGSKYPVLTPYKVVKTLEKFGFEFVSRKGSHMKYSDGEHVVIIPNRSEAARGTLRSILNMAQISLEEFLEQGGF
ncbi:MAG: type II toxin-antitoxin system HicA family toxin [Clostridia bacterium]|nr:type II toxin-antitoxin system HicA family toxin [Clostridia bacterium]